VAYRGRLAAFPNEEYQMSTGVAWFYHNTTKDSLEIFFGFSSVVDIADSPSGFTGLFSVGPPDGHKWWVTREGRETSMLADWMKPVVHSLGKVAQIASWTIPSDFTLLHSHREELGCNDTVLAHVVSNSRGLQEILWSFNKLKQMNALDMFSLIPHMSQAYKSAATWSMCAVEYLRPVHNDSAVVLTPLMFMGLMHVIFELPPEDVGVLVDSHTRWNTVGGKLLGS